MPSFQQNVPPQEYHYGLDPANAMHQKQPDRRLDILSSPDVESIFFVHREMVRQLFLPTLTTTMDTYNPILVGYLGENPANAVLVKIAGSELCKDLLTYINKTENSHIALGTDPIPPDAFTDEERPDLASIGIARMSRWIPKPRGHVLPSIPIGSANVMVEDFEKFHSKDWIEGIYYKHSINSTFLQNPSTLGTEATLPANHDASHVTFALELHVDTVLDGDYEITNDIILQMHKKRESFITDNKASDDHSLVTISSSSMAPSQSLGQGSAPRQSTIPYSINNIPPQIASPPARTKVIQTQALFWRVFGATYHHGKITFPDTSSSFNRLLTGPKEDRLTRLLQMINTVQKKYRTSHHVIKHRCQMPPVNSMSSGFLINCVFQQQHDNEHQRGLNLFHFKAPDITSESYAKYLTNANTVTNEDMVGEESTRRSSKTSEPYKHGKESSSLDLLALLANITAICDAFLVLRYDADAVPEPTILQYLHKFSGLILHTNFDAWLSSGMRSGKSHLIHSLICKMNTIFTQWCAAVRDLEFSDAAEQYLLGKQPSLIFDPIPFQQFVSHANLIIERLHQDIQMSEYNTVATAPPSFAAQRARDTGSAPSSNKRRRLRDSSVSRSGSIASRGLFEPLDAGTRPFVRLPAGCRWCLSFILIGQSCPENADSCQYEHMLCKNISKDQAKQFTPNWFTTNKVKPTAEFKRAIAAAQATPRTTPSDNATGASATSSNASAQPDATPSADSTNTSTTPPTNADSTPSTAQS